MDLKPGCDSLNDSKDFKRKMEITLQRSPNTIRGCKEKGGKKKNGRNMAEWFHSSIMSKFHSWVGAWQSHFLIFMP